MQSFAKAASKPPKPKPAPKNEDEDAAMAVSDDGEADDSDLPAAKKKTQEEADSLRNAKKQREEELRRMMEEDDEEEGHEKEKDEDEDMEDAPEPEPEPEPQPVEEKKEEPSEVVASSGDGRRRGKRRVTKKKRILDDQGYMGKICLHFSLPCLYGGQSGTKANSFLCSDYQRGRVGKLLRGGQAPTGQEADTERNASLVRCEAEEASWQSWPGEHHVFLWEEVRSNLQFLPKIYTRVSRIASFAHLFEHVDFVARLFCTTMLAPRDSLQDCP